MLSRELQSPYAHPRRYRYATDSVGNYNKHINKYSKCKPKEVEECLLCAKRCKVGRSTLRKHVCLADKSLQHFEMQYVLFDAVCLELKSMPDNDFQQLGLASQRPEDVALAAFELLYLNPKHPQYQNTAPCQYNISKLSIV